VNASTFVHPYYFALYPQGAIVTPRAHGLDISKYDQFFKPEMATGQLDFVVQRVSYGVKRDEAFATLVPSVMKVPMRGGYHYLSSWYDWRTQADAYLDFIAGYDYQFHCCDFEGAFNTLSTGFAKQAWDWINYIEQRTGKRTLLYTSLSLYNQYIAPSEKVYGIMWNTVPLWQAQWLLTPNPNGTPGTPIGRQVPWRLWQYTDKGDGTKYGVARSTACDLDVYNGTVEDMRTWLDIAAPPPAGGTMKGTVQVTANIRDVNNVIVGKVYAGDVVYGEVKTTFGLQRLFFTVVYRAGGAVEVWATGSNVAVKTTDGVVILKLTNETEPVPPAPGLPATLYIATKADMSDKVEYRKVV
jgi:GH25 family lysozyme M1 (1,4-beta-N-acetylmuramidase)